MLLTQEAYDTKLKEIDRLKKRLQEVRNEKATSLRQSDGDGRHDNFGFEQAEIQERAVINQIHELWKELEEAEIVRNDKDGKEDIVHVGSKVVLSMAFAEDDIETLEVTLQDFSDLSGNTVTLNSPIGKFIFGKKIGFSGKCKLNNENWVTIKIQDIK